MKITFRGFPWQQVAPSWASGLDKTTGEKYGWNPFSVKGMGRFGGGWAFKFGITLDRSMRDCVLDLGLGSVRIQRKRKEGAR